MVFFFLNTTLVSLLHLISLLASPAEGRAGCGLGIRYTHMCVYSGHVKLITLLGDQVTCDASPYLILSTSSCNVHFWLPLELLCHPVKLLTNAYTVTVICWDTDTFTNLLQFRDCSITFVNGPFSTDYYIQYNCVYTSINMLSYIYYM